jgi:hypothetical protein
MYVFSGTDEIIATSKSFHDVINKNSFSIKHDDFKLTSMPEENEACLKRIQPA